MKSKYIGYTIAFSLMAYTLSHLVVNLLLRGGLL
jgi:hypothetical protein